MIPPTWTSRIVKSLQTKSRLMCARGMEGSGGEWGVTASWIWCVSCEWQKQIGTRWRWWIHNTMLMYQMLLIAHFEMVYFMLCEFYLNYIYYIYMYSEYKYSEYIYVCILNSLNILILNSHRKYILIDILTLLSINLYTYL